MSVISAGVRIVVSRVVVEGAIISIHGCRSRSGSRVPDGGHDCASRSASLRGSKGGRERSEKKKRVHFWKER